MALGQKSANFFFPDFCFFKKETVSKQLRLWCFYRLRVVCRSLFSFSKSFISSHFSNLSLLSASARSHFALLLMPTIRGGAFSLSLSLSLLSLLSLLLHARASERLSRSFLILLSRSFIDVYLPRKVFFQDFPRWIFVDFEREEISRITTATPRRSPVARVLARKR